MGIEYWLVAFAQTFVTVGALAVVVAWKFGILTAKMVEVERRLGRLEDRINQTDYRGD